MIASLALAVSGCAIAVAPQGEAPMRSPTLDYPLPDTTTADGTPLGADRIRVEDKLRMSPRFGSEGFTPAQMPPPQVPALIERQSYSEDPLCDVLGVRRSVLRQRCPGRAVPAAQ